MSSVLTELHLTGESLSMLTVEKTELLYELLYIE